MNKGINSNSKPFKNRVWLSSPTMHGEELTYMTEAFRTNWMTSIGENINVIEKEMCKMVGCKYAVALSTGTSALHLAVKLAGIQENDKVFCSDLTFGATVNPVKYEGGEPVFIDAEYDTWNMDPEALEKAFGLFPDVRAVVVVNLYGTPAKLDELKAICDRHGAVMIEDAAESLGALYKGRQTGTFGNLSAISFNGNKIITGSSGGMLLTDDENAAHIIKKLSTQSREAAPWYQHESIGYNYRMSNVIAGVVRGQLNYLGDHIKRKKDIYQRYKEGFKLLPVTMNPYDENNSSPNFWLSCLLINNESFCKQVRSDDDACYKCQSGKSCPTEILNSLEKYNIEGRPIWKPMHLQPVYYGNYFITRYGYGKTIGNSFSYNNGIDVGRDIFNRGLCLPSDIKMTEKEQDVVIKEVTNCFC